MKTIQLAITEFALPAPRTGSIETYSGYGPIPNVGAELHALVQDQRMFDNPSYISEKWTAHTFEKDGYKITVSGRLDGFIPGHPARIEEIKSAYSPQDLLKALLASPEHPYRLQARTYAYLHWLHTKEVPEINLHVISARTRKGEDFAFELEIPDYELWLDRRLSEVIADAKVFEALKKKRKKTAKTFVFPFAEPRQGQIDLMHTVEKNLDGKTAQLIQAPTGLGKTAGVLFPVLREALTRGEKVIYLTPKNSQHAVAEDAVRRLQETGAKVRGQTIHAKAKLCFKEQVLCNPEYCEYAQDHYDKVSRNDLVAKLAKKKNLTFRSYQKYGREFEVCPFELQLDTLQRADVVICDYNYVFSPRNIQGRLAANGFSAKTKANLIIDEAHNLPARANDYFSARLSSEELRDLQLGLAGLPASVQGLADELIGDTLTFITSAGSESDGRKPCKTQLDTDSILDLAARAHELLARYLESAAQLQVNDAVLNLCNLWTEFSQSHASLSEEFFVSFTPSPRGGVLKITCCDASEWLNENYAKFANVVAFSATVKPFDYYSRLLGFNHRHFVNAEFTSPFPRERRKLLIIPQVSTKYSDREANYGKIKDGIERIIAIQPGNYFVFFPSFDFLSRVHRLLQAEGFQVLAQRREMKRDEINTVLERLRAADQPTLVLAVQGGVFAEGVDYPGEMLIGAIVVGPALPTFDFEREMLRAYYAGKHGDENSFDYAYTFPAMAKVVQSAGRVIRSHSDRGLIVLMDRRFVNSSYVKSMPADWVGDDPHAFVSQQLTADIRRFWEENEAGHD